MTDVTSTNVLSLIRGCDVVLDGCDNFETRLLLNDACLKLRVPWVYGAAIGISGATMAFVPGQGPCFRCIVHEQPAPGAMPTCETAGVLGTVPQIVSAFQATEAIKLLIGRRGTWWRSDRFVDAWAGTVRTVEIRKGDARCLACNEGTYNFWRKSRAAAARVCGRAAVQVECGRVPHRFSPHCPGGFR